MRAVPRGHDAAGRSFAALGRARTPWLQRARGRAAERNGAGDARRFDLRAGANGIGRNSFRDGAMEPFFMSEPVQNEQLRAPSPLIPIPRAPAPEIPPAAPRREIEITIDGKRVKVAEGATILDAAKRLGIETPTLCFLETLTPVNVCRVCVVELEGARTLVPACSRKVERNMSIKTDSERVRLSRRLVIEFLASSVDTSTAPVFKEYMECYSAHPERFGPAVATV